MRHLPSGVCVVTFGEGDMRTGMTATSVSSLSVEPATMLVTVDRASTSYAELARSRAFGVNVLASEHQDVASRFAGRGGEQGIDRYAERRWFTLNSGVWLLWEAVAVLIARSKRSSSVRPMRSSSAALPASSPPAGRARWFIGAAAYDQLGWSNEEISRASA